jgi:tetratricopeptide (TPR) repeat protein
MTPPRHLALSLLCALLLCGCQPSSPPPQGPSGPRTQTVAEATGQPPAPAPRPDPEHEALAQEMERLTALKEPTEEQRRLLGLGKLALDRGDAEGAISAFAQLQDTGPLSGLKLSGAIALADLYREREQHERAIALLERMQAQAPPTPEIALVLGRCYKSARRREEAILAFRDALRMQPLFLQAHVEIGGLLLELGQEEASGQAFLEYEREIYRYGKLLEAADTHPADKKKIAEAFSLMADDRGAQALLVALKDPDPEVRLEVIGALGEVGGHAVLPALREALTQTPEPPLRAAIEAAIRKIEASPSDQGADPAPSFGDKPPAAP